MCDCDHLGSITVFILLGHQCPQMVQILVVFCVDILPVDAAASANVALILMTGARLPIMFVDITSRGSMSLNFYLSWCVRLLRDSDFSCSYGTGCRYDHVRPKKEVGAASAGGSFKKKTSTSLPKPVRLPRPGFNVDAAEFVPSWKRAASGEY